MKVYSLSPQGFLKLRRRFIRRMIIFFLVPVGVVIAIFYYREQESWSSLPALVISTLFLLGVAGFTIYQSIKRQQEIWESVRIEIGDDYIARRQIRISNIRIHHEEIKSVQETNSGLHVYSIDKFRTLSIPIELDEPDYQEIKTTLAAWSPIQAKSSTTPIKNVVQLVLLLIAFGIIFVSMSLWVVLLVGLAMIGYYGYLIWFLKQHTGVDPKYRRNFIYVFGFLVFIISFKVCALSGAINLFFESLRSN